MTDKILAKYETDAAAIALQLETAARRLRARIDRDGLKRAASLHNEIQTAVSTATDLEVTIAIYRRVISRE